ncbi:sugar phosphate isomerase/epimerase family protein [Humisphaera borealis]|uniref:Sugar phosphate isomerase/epimerase n=1 Tax=Humisphaera borealis TaxID=2807512 RepID=A0A7M2WTU5_9BACT|nr:sugar phosphate isomerase/epimerase family protein [Humisphaera borealis]QOV88694.1 sugar phosphate isomerase/epimerase [Humisphaera borealis]
MRFAICNEIFEGWPWEKTCAFAHSLGYTGLEVSPFTLADRAELVTPDRRKELKAQAESRGMEVLGLHWLLVKPAGLYITHTDADIRKKTADYFTALVHLCADLGGKVLIIGSPKQRNLLPGVSTDQALAFAEEVFAPCLTPAAQLGVTLAMEPLGPQETDFLNTAEQTMQLVRRMNSPNFQINLDVKAMSSESKPIPQIIRETAGHIAHVQVNDPNLLGPGMGEVKYEPIIAALREVGYDGWLSVEAFDFRPGAEHIARKSIEYLKQVTGQ